MDTPSELAPHLAALFQGLNALGAIPRRSAAMLARHLPSGRGVTILDAACGKGAVAIAVARLTGQRIIGFDAYPPFVQEAKARAARAGVQHLCRFEIATAEAYFKNPPTFHAAIMLNVWPAPRAAAALRKVVRPGGIYLIDDATRNPRAKSASQFSDMPTLEEATRRIERSGDRVLEVFRPTPTMIRRQSSALFRRIQASAHDLLGNDPELAGPVRELLRRQTRSTRLLTGPLRPTLWAVHRERNDSQPQRRRTLR
jgi:SAM-dependent methyltransferase